MKKIISILLIFSLLFIGCESEMDKYQKEIINDNDKIINSDDSFNLFVYDNKSEKDDSVEVSFERFYGLKTIKTISLDEDKEINFNYECKVDSGEIKVVIIDEEKNIQVLVEGSESGEKSMKLKRGKNIIRMVGSDAKNGSITIN